ncbi:xanthine dehydrogenase accessory protein XdhC [Gluconobacter sphaericus]|uniref:Xanthine dehydrogenase accessory protein XdhC n=1 Tax=Gluconobacter sphaericus NBRC 12467 TaxID=1307951 RepID=A0AA37SID4_9PROT|nr:xanthine dehydrogenase accessory protein XdhC [Gluconobacter sphaericus]MBF0885060.1 xanthine dehydrogenase accessory protein XdhC [Gluconobacter sphaericus]GBR51388.1 xanthine dehydrogenase XdhC [Gluconobacter sphaericus NBRC 12467]GEB41864.1 xanthine dehydrogenase accessory protein XdhC [Gluconobacter sphaericus NBRC 12467]GLQ84179.1 xanthine dehydrogenase accessory protein XdhC [Gluconobacter sphaericus NBRC 12467]
MLADVLRWRAEGQEMVRLTVIRAKGSTPREEGAFMLLTRTEQSGTIGGGRLEWDCMAEARALLVSGGEAVERHIPLGPAINQCCGGAVTIRMERVSDPDALEDELRADREKLPQLLLFGAGHVGCALARALALLPLRLVWVDAREEEFGIVPPGVEVLVTEQWESLVQEAPAGSGVLVLTQSHTLDALITGAALERGDLRYVGMIGSRTKRKRFESAFRQVDIPPERIDRLVCPIGDFGVRDKRPEVIATFVTAEIAARMLCQTELCRDASVSKTDISDIDHVTFATILS